MRFDKGAIMSYGVDMRSDKSLESIIHSISYSDEILRKNDHYHDCHQILFIKNGEVEVSINGIEHRAGKGDMIILSRYESHGITVISDVYERYVLRISPLPTYGGEEYLFLTMRPPSFKNIVAAGELYDTILLIFSELVAETVKKDSFSERMCSILVSQLLIYISRMEPVIYDFGDKNIKAILDIQRRIESDQKESYSLKQLAEQYHISESTLSHRFKKIVGTSVLEYLYSCRIASAKKLLVKTDMSISEIVESCGFTDCANFSRTFKMRTGMTPTKFRKTYKEI